MRSDQFRGTVVRSIVIDDDRVANAFVMPQEVGEQPFLIPADCIEVNRHIGFRAEVETRRHFDSFGYGWLLGYIDFANTSATTAYTCGSRVAMNNPRCVSSFGRTAQSSQCR